MIFTKLMLLMMLQHTLYAQIIVPAALRALATVHNTRARAIANAINLRARRQYNTALARSRNNLGLDRFTRDSNNYFPLEYEFDNDNNIDTGNSEFNNLQELFPGENIELEDEDARNPDEDIFQENSDFYQNLDHDLDTAEKSSGDVSNFKYFDSTRSSKLDDNLMQIPLDFDNFLESEGTNMRSDNTRLDERILSNKKNEFERKNDESGQTNDPAVRSPPSGEDPNGWLRTVDSPMPILSGFLPTITKLIHHHNLPTTNPSQPNYYYNQFNYPVEELLHPNIFGMQEYPLMQQNYEFGKEKSADPHLSLHKHPHKYKHIHIHDKHPAFSKHEKFIEPIYTYPPIPSGYSKTYFHKKVNEPFGPYGERLTQKASMFKPNSDNKEQGLLELKHDLEENDPRVAISLLHKKFGTSVNDDMETPEFPYFEQGQPQNRQGIVNYIETMQDHIKQMLPNVDKSYIDDYDIDNYYKPYQIDEDKSIDVHSYEEPDLLTERSNRFAGQNYFDNDQFQQHKFLKNFPNSNDKLQLTETNFGDEKGEIYNTHNIHLYPEPASHENFGETNREIQKEALINYLNTEEQNVDNIFKQISEHYQHDMNALKDLIDTDYSHNTPDEHDYLEPHDQIQIEETDILDYERNAKKNHHKTFPKFSENHLELAPIDLFKLGYMIQVPDRRYAGDFLRQSRSLNETEIAEIKKLLVEKKSLIHSLKKDVDEDANVMKIGSIVRSLLEDLDKRINKTKRSKREIGESPDVQFKRIFTDPRTQLNMPKTLDNLGAVTRHTFESDKAPLYHMRNMVGSAQNAMLAAMKIPSRNFLIPSDYDIVYRKERNENVNAINPNLFPKSGQQNVRDNTMDAMQENGVLGTFQKVGSAIREGIVSGQEGLYHAGDAAKHAKSAVYSTKNITPRLILKQSPLLVGTPKETLLITPRIFDISEDNDLVGNTFINSQPDFVKVGNILDAVGISNPKPSQLHIDQFLIKPSAFPASNHFIPFVSNTPTALKNFLDNIRNMHINDKIIGKTIKNLNDAKRSVGAINLKDFFAKMKQHLQPTLRNQQYQTQGTSISTIPKLPQTYKYPENHKVSKSETLGTSSPHNSILTSSFMTDPMKQEQYFSRSKDDQIVSDPEYVRAKFLVNDQLIHPFMNQISQTDLEKLGGNMGYPIQKLTNQETPIGTNEQEPLDREKIAKLFSSDDIKQTNNYEENYIEWDQNQRDRDLGQILGAINPVMFERMFNETLKNRNISDTPHSIFHHQHDGHSHGSHLTENNDNPVGISMSLTPHMLTPFMGHATNQDKFEFFSNPTPGDAEEGYDSPESDEYSSYPIKTNWDEIIQPTQQDMTSEE